MRTYIKAGRLVDCTGADAIRPPVVLVEDGRIIQVGTSQTLEIPAGSEVIGTNGDTELFKKSRNINGFRACRIANNLY